MASRSRRILIVDDDPGIRKSLDLVLSRQGFTVTTVESAEAALAAIEKGAPDVVLTDLYMRGLDGLALILTLRRRVRDLPILAMSGAAENDIMISARKLGADAAIRKPFGNAELVALIDYYMNKPL